MAQLTEAPFPDVLSVPSHIALVMDGNRRWAARRQVPPMMGHWKGAEVLTQITRAASDLGVRTLTVYSFSTENWSRPPEEVEALMHLFRVYLAEQREPMQKEGVRLETIGDLSRLPQFVQEELEKSKCATAACKKIDLVLAINYGGRDDLKRAFVSMLDDVERGLLRKEEITEGAIGRYLDTARWSDPELLIRTSGEMRQSNFLLWQLCYSEFYYTDVLWPDFTPRDLQNSIEKWQARRRRLGG